MGVYVDGNNLDVHTLQLHSNGFIGDGIDLEGFTISSNPEISRQGNSGTINDNILGAYKMYNIQTIPTPRKGFFLYDEDNETIDIYTGTKRRILSAQNMYSILYENDFDDGSLKGMVLVNDSLTKTGHNGNKWIVGEEATDDGQSLYITDDGQTLNNYDYWSDDPQVSHVYIDIDIPSDATSVSIDFYWKGYGEKSYDFLKVYDISNSTTPSAGTQLSSSDQIGNSEYNQTSAWQSEGIAMGDVVSKQGTTRRIVWSWRNDGSVGDEPSAIDKIKIQYK